MGKMAVNDRAESSFAGITAQIQDYGWIGLANGAAIRSAHQNRLERTKEGHVLQLVTRVTINCSCCCHGICTNNLKIK
jgi:hypothetical protein